MTAHLKRNGHENKPFTPVTADCGAKFMHLPKGDIIVVGEVVDLQKFPKAKVCEVCRVNIK